MRLTFARECAIMGAEIIKIVREDYEYADTPKMSAGICWIKGTEPDIYLQSHQCWAAVAEAGYSTHKLTAAKPWCEFERYNASRFDSTDADGNQILDLGILLN